MDISYYRTIIDGYASISNMNFWPAYLNSDRLKLQNADYKLVLIGPL